MFRPVRVRVPKARLSPVTPYQLAAESTGQSNHDGHDTPSTLSPTGPQTLQPPIISNPPSPSFLTRLISHFKITVDLPSCPCSKPSKADQPGLRKRDALESQNVTIGVVVGVFLAIFLVALFYFLYRYNASIRLKRKRRKRRGASRKGSGSSKGSTSSTNTQGSGPPPEPVGV